LPPSTIKSNTCLKKEKKPLTSHSLPLNSKKKLKKKNQGAPFPLEQSKNKLLQLTLPPSTVKSNLQKLQAIKKITKNNQK